MKTVEIPIDIPQHTLDEYDVVAFRIVKAGELGLLDGEVIHFHIKSVYPYLILRPKAQWPEWPEWLTADWVVQCIDGEWVFGFGVTPPAGDNYWEWAGSNRATLGFLRFFTNITPPTYDGPWQHSLIRNPWKGGE